MSATTNAPPAAALPVTEPAKAVGASSAARTVGRELAGPAGVLAAVLAGVNAPAHPGIATAAVITGAAAYGITWVRARRSL